MDKVYICPYCNTRYLRLVSSYEDGGGDYGEDLIAVLDCPGCGHTFSESEAFWRWETEPREVPDAPPTMHYQGDRTQIDTLQVVFTYKGEDYKFDYSWISSLRKLYGMPEPIRQRILRWAEMLHRPD